jgi:hypothetical protein
MNQLTEIVTGPIGWAVILLWIADQQWNWGERFWAWVRTCKKDKPSGVIIGSTPVPPPSYGGASPLDLCGYGPEGLAGIGAFGDYYGDGLGIQAPPMYMSPLVSLGTVMGLGNSMVMSKSTMAELQERLRHEQSDVLRYVTPEGGATMAAIQQMNPQQMAGMQQDLRADG